MIETPESTEAGPAGQESEQHPELGGERLHLAATLEAMRRAVDAPLKIAMGDFAATLYMESYRAWRRMELREALDSPYFARIDFKPDDRAATETYYLGKTYVAEGSVEVTGWQAPVAALFYRSTTSRSSYRAPMGEIAGDVRLKRRFVIDHSALRHIADDLDERPLTAGARRVQHGLGRDEVLRQVLSGHASPWLRDIIVTIQGDQYALITAPADKVLLIQGVAGSGKTSIALHRLSYLVYPSLVAAKLPPRCIVFGPNRLFLKYVSAVLPKLGLQHVVQTTVAEWAIERIGLKGHRVVDSTFEALLSNRTGPEEKERLARRSRLKTSRRMATLLERYVERRRAQVQVPDTGWLFELNIARFPGSLEQQRLRRQLDAGELRAAHAKHAGRSFAIHRAMFAESVLTMVTSLFDAAQTPADAEAQAALGRKRLEQAEELRAEAKRQQVKFAAAAQAPTARPPRNEAVLNPGFSLPSQTGRVMPPSRPSAGPTGPAGPSGPGGSLRPTSASPARGAAPMSPRDVEMLRQTIRQLELAAERRRQEGDALLAESRATRAAAMAPEQREQALKGARAEVKRLVEQHWPDIDPAREYYALLSNGPLLRELGAGLFTPEELDLIAGSAARESKKVDAADLPALHYLFIISQSPDDMGAINHDYVVVDEAQDLSEVDLLCLRVLERKQSFTLLGDLSQSIYAHRGLSSWDQARAAFQDRPTTYEECPVSYRTTAEITALSNRVLGSLGTVEDGGRRTVDGRETAPRLAEAFDRHGPAPELREVAGEAALVQSVKEAIDEGVARGYRSVAVIAKTPERACEVFDELQEAGASDVRLLSQPDVEYEGGVVVVPVALAKGLEFDAAILVDADTRTYGPSAFDGRLLYVALTRAMHALYVIWTRDSAGASRLTPHLRAEPWANSPIPQPSAGHIGQK